MTNDPILGFNQDPYRFLSNMYPCTITIDGLTFKCSEALYAACKTGSTKSHYEKFTSLNGFEAKKLGRKLPQKDNWDEIKVDIMFKILSLKFSQNPDLRQLLIDTHPRYIEETNTWNDKFWGVCNGKGENHLGKLLMSLRFKYVEEGPNFQTDNITESLFPEDFPNIHRVGITGHRPKGLLSLSKHDYVNYDFCNRKLSEFMHSVMFPMILQKYPDPVCYSGMALGADQVFIETAQQLGLKTVAVVPYPEQPNVWVKSAQEHYHKLCSNATEVITVFPDTKSGLLTFGQMLMVRNKSLVDKCTNLVALYDNLPNSGTANAVAYARQRRKPVANFWKLWINHLAQNN